MNRGRPMKKKLTPIESKHEAIKKHDSGQALTLDETRFAMWEPESESKPMSIMGVQKIEVKALAKLKTALAAYGLKNIDDFLESKHHFAKIETVDNQF